MENKLFDHLISIMRHLPSDLPDDGEAPDCASGCAYYLELAGQIGEDFGVCANTESPRCGLLTFEHAGCSQFVNDEGLDEPEKSWPEPYIPKMWRISD